MRLHCRALHNKLFNVSFTLTYQSQQLTYVGSSDVVTDAIAQCVQTEKMTKKTGETETWNER